ncbi:PaaX family transcriptional regulator C-terminal domain-containing protein [Streptomyces sp. NBC_00893]|uniref:PaaX family transcriptional regulator C-terminal domain-containing protein n=1 Tax=Streptomyces sp. NBC_00893 TaxID=2975862 RepID=UPI0022530D68|nr:PaaX family transcriptional regulator C-terminal domain-containing protein [Streptomyces sp. NBC_00893]MCX4847364.1 transcriptional regulator [Streptomyces sp. NBC_00893]
MNGTRARAEVPTRLLVHALVREDGTVDAGELYEVAGILGMSDQQVRLCVKRLVAEGRFTHEGRGRKAVLRAVADATGAIAPDADHVRHAYRQDHGLAPWDGTWHLFAFAVPEARRAARDTLRDKLLHLGAAPVQGGLYASANPIEDLVEAEARHLGVLPALTFLTSEDLRIGTLHEPRELAASLWPLKDIAARYDRLSTLAESCLQEMNGTEAREEAGEGRGEEAREGAKGLCVPEAERLTMAVELAAEFTRAMEPDPLLPPELLPHPWPGSRARELAATCWSRLATPGLQRPDPEPEPGSLPSLFSLYRDVLRPPTDI